MRTAPVRIRHRLLAAFLLLAAMAASPGCVPERVAWSPDGTQAAVLGVDGLHLCEPTGKLGPALMGPPSRVVWLDKRRLVVSVGAAFQNWPEVVRDLPEAAVDKALADRVRGILVAHSSDWKQAEEALKEIPEDQRLRAMMFLRDTEPALRETLGDNYQHLVDSNYSPERCQVFELGGGGAGAGASLIAGPILFYGKHGRSAEMRPSPDGRFLLVTMTSYSDQPADKEDPKLFIIPTDVAGAPGARPKAVALGPGCTYPDWSADGTTLYFVQRNGTAEEKIGYLERLTVVGKDGKILEARAKPERLATILYDAATRVRVAPSADGRIYLNAKTPDLITPSPRIFAVDTAKPGALVSVYPVEGTSDGESLQYFQLSPDGKRIAVAGEHGEIRVVSVPAAAGVAEGGESPAGSGGRVAAVQPKVFQGKNDKLDCIPTWRTAEELTFVRPAGGGQREVITLNLSTGKEIVLSGTWGAAVTDSWTTAMEPPAGLP